MRVFILGNKICKAAKNGKQLLQNSSHQKLHPLLLNSAKIMRNWTHKHTLRY